MAAQLDTSISIFQKKNNYKDGIFKDMEALAFLIVSTGIGYCVHMAHRIDERIDLICERLVKLEFRMPKRKTDRSLEDLDID